MKYRLFFSLIVSFCLILFWCIQRIIPKDEIKTVESLDKEWLSSDITPLIFGTIFQESEVSGKKVPKQISLLKAYGFSQKQATEWNTQARLAFIDAIALFVDSQMKILQWNFLFTANGKNLLVKVVGKNIEAIEALSYSIIKWNFIQELKIEMIPSIENFRFPANGFGHFYIAIFKDNISYSLKVIFSSQDLQVAMVWDPISRKIITPSDSLTKSIIAFDENRLLVLNSKKWLSKHTTDIYNE